MNKRAQKLFAIAIITASCALCYHGTLDDPFHFDGHSYIEKNEAIRDITDIGSIWSYNPVRFLVFFSFAVNYALGGLDVAGYHLVNIAIHMINALLVWRLAGLLTLTRWGAGAPGGNDRNTNPGARFWFPLFAALLFAAHPLQTQAVTYLWQRATSLAVLFYLLSLTLYLASRLIETGALLGTHRRAKGLFAASALAAVAAMFTKQIAVTLPVAIVMAEYFFFAHSYTELRKRTALFAVFLPILMIIPALTALGLNEEIVHIGAAEKNMLSSHEYLLTQFNVLVLYLRLLVLPVHQNLDYDFPAAHSIADSWTSLAFLLILAGFAAWLYRKNRIASFGLFFFFLSASVESSLFPLEDLVFEHRMYLPSAGLFIAFTALAAQAAHVMPGKPLPVIIALFAAWTVAYGAATINRNEVWRDEVSLWEDVVMKSPGKPRGYVNLGVAYAHNGRERLAERMFQKALDVDDTFAVAHYSLGLLQSKQGRDREAIKSFQNAVRLDPIMDKAHRALAYAYMKQKRYAQAVPHFRALIRLDASKYWNTALDLGVALTYSGGKKEAIALYEWFLSWEPDNKTARHNLAALRAGTGNGSTQPPPKEKMADPVQ